MWAAASALNELLESCPRVTEQLREIIFTEILVVILDYAHSMQFQRYLHQSP